MTGKTGDRKNDNCLDRIEGRSGGSFSAMLPECGKLIHFVSSLWNIFFSIPESNVAKNGLFLV